MRRHQPKCNNAKDLRRSAWHICKVELRLRATTKRGRNNVIVDVPFFKSTEKYQRALKWNLFFRQAPEITCERNFQN